MFRHDFIMANRTWVCLRPRACCPLRRTCGPLARRSLSVAGNPSRQLRNDDSGTGGSDTSVPVSGTRRKTSCKVAPPKMRFAPSDRTGSARGGRGTRWEDRTAGGHIVVVRILGKLMRNKAGGGPQRRLGRVPERRVHPQMTPSRPNRTERHEGPSLHCRIGTAVGPIPQNQ
jgi:hypothetical protein